MKSNPHIKSLVKKSLKWPEYTSGGKKSFFLRWRLEYADLLGKVRLWGRQSYARHAEKRRADARLARDRVRQDPIKLAKHRAWCCSNVKKKKLNNPEFRIKFAMRNRISMSLGRGVAKSGRTVELLGCTIQEYKSHIESLWKDGMSWANYGRGNDKWHIDHIIPCAAFDLTNPDEQKKCFNYKNTQPLWALENLSKGDRITNKEECFGVFQRIK